jgi:hypothetical protein
LHIVAETCNSIVTKICTFSTSLDLTMEGF